MKTTEAIEFFKTHDVTDVQMYNILIEDLDQCHPITVKSLADPVAQALIRFFMYQIQDVLHPVIRDLRHPGSSASKMTDEQIKHMVNRFLQWRLPENFNPDGGISFKKTFNENTPWPMKHEPVGTNLFDASQAEDMVRYMAEGMPSEPSAGL